MATITFGGAASGLDTEAIISGLLSASRTPLNTNQARRSQVNAAVSTVSNVGSLLSQLERSVESLDTVREAGSFKVTSSDDRVAASTNGNASPGSFDLVVTQLAGAYKSYSNALNPSATDALGQSGTLDLTVGGESASLNIEAGDSLEDVVRTINESGLRVSATALFDGSNFRVQLRGLDTGEENAVSVSETGTSLGFASNEVSQAQNARFTIDGQFEVSSASNQVTGVIGGVTLGLAQVSPLDDEGAPIATRVEVESDPEALEQKLGGVVKAYNDVINAVHGAAGFGSTAATNSVLSGDNALRSITARLSSTLTQAVGSGRFQSLGAIGVELNNNGTLKLNQEKLREALAEDPDAVMLVLAGDDSGDELEVSGMMDRLATLAGDFLDPGGLIQTRKDGLDARSTALAERIEEEERRLTRLEEQLRRQFNRMDQVVGANQTQLDFLLSNSQ